MEANVGAPPVGDRVSVDAGFGGGLADAGADGDGIEREGLMVEKTNSGIRFTFCLPHSGGAAKNGSARETGGGSS